MARTKGTPNKKGHKAGGDRKSSAFKAAIATKKFQKKLVSKTKYFLTRRRRIF